ncbi:MAG: hypothetical protein M1839_007118 [Geoglossum umbratile]|nr:MAG: hypothetical protein M1839_007118 [Geoglossum umbratile]
MTSSETLHSSTRWERPRRRRSLTLKTNDQPHYMQPTVNSSARRLDEKPSRLSNSSSLSLSQSLCHRPVAPRPAHDPSVAATNSAHISWLWERVMSYTIDTESSKGKRKAKVPLTGSTTPASALTSGQRKWQTPAMSETSSTRTRKEVAAKIADTDFANVVLQPCGITIQNMGVNKNLYKHFRIQEHDLPSNLKDRLAAYRKTHALEVWLDPDIERTQREYKAMEVYGCNEAEHSAYALRDIFLDEARHPWLPEQSGDQRWLPVRMLQLVQKPAGDDDWCAPPIINSPCKRYQWDIRPDCAYYISLQAFQSGFRPSVRNHVAVVQKRAICPYLTVEFKKDEETLATAQHQIAVASAMALYNRYRLKNCALQMSGEKWSEQDKDQMRHYGVTFTGSTWKLWYTVPQTFQTWTGCVMSTIYSGDCCILAGVQQLIGIINDIHYWGLEVHGRSCKKDIATKIHSDPDADANDITLLGEVQIEP